MCRNTITAVPGRLPKTRSDHVSFTLRVQQPDPCVRYPALSPPTNSSVGFPAHRQRPGAQEHNRIGSDSFGRQAVADKRYLRWLLQPRSWPPIPPVISVTPTASTREVTRAQPPAPRAAHGRGRLPTAAATTKGPHARQEASFKDRQDAAPQPGQPLGGGKKSQTPTSSTRLVLFPQKLDTLEPLAKLLGSRLGSVLRFSGVNTHCSGFRLRVLVLKDRRQARRRKPRGSTCFPPSVGTPVGD